MIGKIDRNLIGSYGIDGPGGSNIKSIQKGLLTLTTPASQSVAISAVNPSNSVIVVWFNSTTSGIEDHEVAKGDFVNSTTISISRAAADTVGGLAVSWTVIEFNNVKSKQEGLIALNSTSNSLTISSVDLNKSIYFCGGAIDTNNGYTGNQLVAFMCSPYFTSATSLVFSPRVSKPSMSIKWQVIEFN